MKDDVGLAAMLAMAAIASRRGKDVVVSDRAPNETKEQRAARARFYRDARGQLYVIDRHGTRRKATREEDFAEAETLGV